MPSCGGWWNLLTDCYDLIVVDIAAPLTQVVEQAVVWEEVELVVYCRIFLTVQGQAKLVQNASSTQVSEGLP